MTQPTGFTLGQKLFEAANTVIYRGYQHTSQQDHRQTVIIKLLKGEFPSATMLARFKNEFHLLNTLQQAGTVAAYSIEPYGNSLALVMEEFGTYSLQTLLARQGALDLAQFFTIALEITGALEQIHRHHIIHKDINPSNILWDETNQQAKIIDFGISSILMEQEVDIPDLHALEGRLSYVAPEQTGRMNRSIDYRVDFYSLGATFYEMLTGQVPFPSRDMLELIHCHLAKIPVSVSILNPTIPEMVANIVAKLLFKIPEQRYASALGIKADLLECQAQWQRNGAITCFPLAQQDIYDRLIPSQTLYGREQQIKQLVMTFERIRLGSSELLLIAGYSGVGKTSLVKQIYKPVTRQQGYFVSGKFDPLSRSHQYSAVIEAFQELVRSLLTGSDEQLTRLKNQLLAALGHNGQVIIDIIPNLALIIGVQPPVLALQPMQAQQRLVHTFQLFVGALSQAEYPLVIFLDDLQWADLASLQLIETLMAGNELHYFLMIGAYRDNEVAANHPLMHMQQQLQKSGTVLNTLSIRPLKQEDVRCLLADSLNLRQERVAALASLIIDKTQGNPFFINEFLKKLYYDKLLVFSYQQSEWQWDLAHIEQQAVTANVIDLSISCIFQLPKQTQAILELAACIGPVFDLATLSIISEQPLAAMVASIQEATRATLITPLDQSDQLLQDTSEAGLAKLGNKMRYRFIHDQIQQAAYRLMPEASKPPIHLQIGRLLLNQQTLQEKDPRLFEMVNHLNYGLALITDAHEKQQLAHYNLWAGKKAKASAAHQTATEYFQIGVALLAEFELQAKPDFFFELSKELATSQFLTGETEKATASFQQLLNDATAGLSLIEVSQLNCTMLAALGKHQAAFTLGNRALAAVGIHLPAKPGKLQILIAIIKIQLQLPWHTLQDFKLLPNLSPPEKAVSALLGQLVSSTAGGGSLFGALLACTQISFCLKHGYASSTTSNGLIYAAILMHKFHWYKKSVAFIDFLLKSEQEYGLASQKGRIYSTLGATLDPWRLPLEQCADTLRKAYQYAKEEGDVQCAFSSSVALTWTILLIGQPLIHVIQQIQAALNSLPKSNIPPAGPQLFTLAQHLLNCLSEPTLDKTAISKQFARSSAEDNNSVRTLVFCSLAIMVDYILGDIDEARTAGALWQKQLIKQPVNFALSVQTCLFYALTLMATRSAGKRACLKQVEKMRALLSRWAMWCPYNYQKYLTLLDAELARVNNNTVLAAQLYRQAIHAAEQQQTTHLIAVANECAGRFYATMNVPEVAKLYIVKAHYYYQSWGATAKCRLLEKNHPQWLQTTTPVAPTCKMPNMTIASTSATVSSPSAPTSIDVLSLLKSTQTIAGEIELDKLLKTLLITLLQDTGAQRSAVLMKEGDTWYVQAEGTLAAPQIYLTPSQRLDQRENLPCSLIRQVQRTQEAVLIQSSHDLKNYLAEDSYLAAIMPQSILVMPVVYQGQLKNIIYLENTTTSHAFTGEHMRVFQLLSSQAAISLENARLYYQATHDGLTCLANRNLLYQLFDNSASRAKRNNSIIAILFIDLDGFKKINDTLGHAVGDKLLIYFADQLRLCLREADLAVRLGGDEFAAMLEEIDINQVNHIAERLLTRLRQPAHIMEHSIPIAASIGISLFPHDGQDIATLLKRADIALYRAKSQGKGHHQFYTDSLDQQVKKDSLIELNLRQALAQQQLRVYYQPIYAASTQKLASFEALLRWQHPQQGLITAEKFIDLAEKTGLILPIGEWVVRAVMQQIHTWLAAGLEVVPVAVNVSGVQFKKQSLSGLLAKLLQEIPIDARYLSLEFTESIFIEHSDQILSDIAALKKLGFKLILDDFGSGFSSLAYLRRFPIDQIKIDRSFIHNMQHNTKDRELILAIIAIGHSLKLQVVAEGVENAQQLAFLQHSQVDMCQGYYLGKPADEESSRKLLAKISVLN